MTDETFSLELTKASPHLISQLIRDDQDYYLRKVDYQGLPFIGKLIKDTTSLEELENAENHIISILKQLVPNYSFENNPLILLAIHE